MRRGSFGAAGARCVTVVAALWLQQSVATAHPPSFSLEVVMQAPFPSSLVAAEHGKALAWVFDTRGVRNVWVADAAHAMQARPVTGFTEDDGSNIAELAWSPDLRLLAFTRGGSLEDDRPANVSNAASGASAREVWIVPLAGGAARRLGAGHAPAFSADGSRVIFIHQDRLMTSALEGDAPAATLLADSGRIAAVSFSADGARVAFVSARAGHSLIGVYELRGRRVQWMSPSLDQDLSPVFSPDGTQVAFIRVPTEKNPEFVTRRTGQPWSIWVAQADSGRGRRAWVADAGAGSVFHPTLSEQNLLWTRHGSLVFPWEKTGWLQLYAVGPQGGVPRPLTMGSFEVAHLTLNPDRTRLLFSSNQGDEDRLHVWTMNADGGTPVRAGSGAAIEDAPQMSADGTLFALQSAAHRPLQPVMLSGNRWQPLAPQALSAAFPEGQLVHPQSVTFPAHDGQTAHGQLFLPAAHEAAARHAAILFFHGGPQRQMLLGFHPMDAYNWMYALNQYFAAEGYIVLSVNYRGGIGYGLDYREANAFGPAGGSEVNDLLGAITYLKGRPDVDPRRLGIWGGSYGGLMTALGLARASDSLAAGVDYAGLYNWATFLASVGVPVDSPDAARLALQSSPVATIDAWKSPVLVVQADDDRDVPPQQSIDLIEDLRSHHIDHEQLMLPNEIHNLARYASWMTLFEATDAYFRQHLQGRDAPARP